MRISPQWICQVYIRPGTDPSFWTRPWTGSNRNGGRLHLGLPGRLASESASFAQGTKGLTPTTCLAKIEITASNLWYGQIQPSGVAAGMGQLMGQLFALVALMGIGAGFSKVEAASNHEEAVIVHFDYGTRDWSPFFHFEKEFKKAIATSAIGEYDGNELAVDGSDGSMYMYGPDAEKLFAFVQPRLLAATFLKNVTVTLRYGAASDPSARTTKIQLSQ